MLFPLEQHLAARGRHFTLLTVTNHVQKIRRKLNVLNRTQAIGKALALRILNP
ncbi:MAG: hypothetical protein HY527_09340 [Betaproteobacteria bacterium]|nr:hypothetical protein [Betaproteobacteria bacterium]